MNYHHLVHLDLEQLLVKPAGVHCAFMSFFSALTFMTGVTSQLWFYFGPGDVSVVTSEHVLCCAGLMGRNYCKRANLTNLLRRPRVPEAAFNHSPQ